MPKRKASSPTLRRFTSVDLGSITNPTPSAWTATRLERCSLPPDSDPPLSMHWCHCWRSTVCGSPKRSGPTSRPWASSEAIGPSPSCAREVRPSPSRWHLVLPGRSIWPSANVTAVRSSSRRTVGVLIVTGASRVVRRVARRAEITKPIGPHTLRHAFITAALDAGVPLRDVQEAASHADPRTTMRYDRARVSLDRHATYIVAAYLAGAAR